ncbi:MAG: DUF2505 family protein [Leptospiraceae bacterium]|nr:DUF2505 family protein [Leptospiraceae bacterium]
MQQASLDHRFPFSFEQLVEIREERYKNLHIWDMFAAAILLKEDDTGDLRTREYKLLIKTALPLFAQKLLANGEALACYEVTTLDRKKREYRSETVLRIVNSAINFTERALYAPDGTDRSKRHIDIEANVRIPAIGRAIEKLIVYEFKEQSAVDCERILKFAAERYPRP